MSEFDFGPTITALIKKRDELDSLIESLRRYSTSDCGSEKTGSPIQPQARNPSLLIPINRERTNGFWTTERRDDLWKRYQNGEKAKGLSKHFGVSEQTIYNQITKLKLERNMPVQKSNVINGPEPMTKAELTTFCIQRGENLYEREGALYYCGEKITDQELLNIANTHRKQSSKQLYVLRA